MADLISGTCSLRSEKAGMFHFSSADAESAGVAVATKGREGYDSVKLAANVVSDNPAIRFFLISFWTIPVWFQPWRLSGSRIAGRRRARFAPVPW